MTKHLRILASALLLSTVVTGCEGKDDDDKEDSSRAMAASRPTAAERAADETAIRQMDDQFFAAVKAKDATAIAAMYAADAISMPANSPPLTGATAIRDFNAETLKLPNLNLTGESQTIRFSDDGTVAYETGKYSMSFTDAKGRVLMDEGKFLNVLKKTDGKWLIVADAFSSNLPPPK